MNKAQHSAHPLGESRTVVADRHAMIGPDSHVSAPLFGWEETEGVILVSPAMGSNSGSHPTRGPGFAMYLATLSSASRTTSAPEQTQRCLIVIDGQIELDGNTLSRGDFAYLPAGTTYDLSCPQSSKLLAFEKRYVPLNGVPTPKMHTGSLDQAPCEDFFGDPGARLATLLPTEPSYDMAVNAFTFDPGTPLPFVESHVMEHGLFMYQGSGVYRLDNEWYPVTQGDAIWMAAYCPQWFVAMGKSPATYIYYKDIHRNHLPHS